MTPLDEVDDPAPDRLSELADIFATALMRLRARIGPTAADSGEKPPSASVSCLDVLPETALSVPTGFTVSRDFEKGAWNMPLNVARELAELQRLNVKTLVGRYAELFGEVTKTRNKVWLIKRLIWRLQAREEGDLSERARQRAAELANDADLRLSPPQPRRITTPAQHVTAVGQTWKSPDRLPPPGSVIARPYKGRTLQVQVLPTGFEYEGEVYKSLSAVAKYITGSHCNGFLFFRLTGKEAQV